MSARFRWVSPSQAKLYIHLDLVYNIIRFLVKQYMHMGGMNVRRPLPFGQPCKARCYQRRIDHGLTRQGD